jgi:hypothetical protein
VFEQGEYFHPGLMAACQAFFDHAGIALQPSAAITHSLNAVFSNYIVARPRFWQRWLELADRLFEFVEGSAGLSTAVVSYGTAKVAPLKTFIQERLASVVLLQDHFEVLSFFPSASGSIFQSLFVVSDRTRRLLIACDRAKQLYAASGEQRYLDAYQRARSQIQLSRPPGAGRKS